MVSLGPIMTGYDTEDRYWASCYMQGERKVYSIDLSLASVAATLPRPDPQKPTLGNRRVNEAHARGFGKYVRESPDWVAPALLLRAPEIFVFQAKEEVEGSKFGVLSLPRLARTDIRILDGQHRILGLHYAVEDIAAELEKARSLAASARRDGNADLERHHQLTVKKLEEQRARLSRERISVQVHIEDDPQRFMQMFVDIADNALGITSAIRARFDSRKVVNRALEEVLKHPLLANRVDMEQDRITPSSTSLMGAKHATDIIRTVTVGIGGRIGRRQEDELREAALVEKANSFFDVLIAGFGDIEQVMEGSKTPEELRDGSLLGSTTMLRVLAGVYYDLVRDIADEDISQFFSKLSAHMGAPIADGSPWLNRISAPVFSPGAYAPKARGGDMSVLKDHLVRWAKDEPEWLTAA